MKMTIGKSILKQGFKKSVVVVEIGNDWLKILEYNPTHKGGTVTRASLVKLVQIKEPVTEAISKAFRNLKLSRQEVIICIPRHLVTIRILEFPSTTHRRHSQSVLRFKRHADSTSVRGRAVGGTC